MPHATPFLGMNLGFADQAEFSRDSSAIPVRSSNLAPLDLSSPPLMRALEPRILLDAAAVETAVDTVSQAIHSGFADDYLENKFQQQTSKYEPLPVPTESEEPDREEVTLDAVETPKQVIFLASDIRDLGSKLQNISTDAEVIVIDADRDGVEQMAEALAGRSDIGSIHIFSHGDEGVLTLGNTPITWQSMLSEHTAGLAMIGAALAETGDILIYGCDFAAGDEGEYAAEIMAHLTGADIAASNDVTGHQSLGGDWDLEHQTGTIEATTIAAKATWKGALGGEILEEHEVPFADVDHSEYISSDKSIGQTFKHSGGGPIYHVNQVDLVLRIDDGAPLQDVIVEIRDVHGGTILATGTLSGSALGTDYGWHSIFMEPALTLSSSTEYNLTITTTGSTEVVQVAVEHDEGYNRGERLREDGSVHDWHDLLFRVVGNNRNFDPEITSDGGLASTLLTQNEGTKFVTDVVATDADIPADTISYSIIGGSDADKFQIDTDTGELEFITAPDFENPTDTTTNNTYTVLVEASDEWGATDTQSISVSVADADDLPVATGGAVITDEEMPYNFVIADFGFNDDEGDALQSITVSNLSLAGGTLSLAGGTIPVTNGMTITAAQIAGMTVTPVPDSSAGASFDYVVNDANPGIISAPMLITINPINDPPVATGGAVITDEDIPFNFDVADFGFSDVEGDALQSITVSNLSLAGGTLSLAGGTIPVTNGMTITAAQIADLTFTPAPNSSAGASFDYAANDADPGVASAAMAITVSAINDAPLAGALSDQENNDSDTPTFDASTAFTDLEGDPLTFSATGLPTGLSVDPSTGVITGTIDSSASVAGTYLVEIHASDPSGAQASANFSWAITNPSPTAIGESYSGVEDFVISGTVAGNDTDADGDSISYLLETDSAKGTVVLNSDGKFIFTPNQHQNGSDGFTYQVVDADGATAFASVSLYLSPVNDRPVALDISLETVADAPLLLGDTVFAFTDQEGDSLTAVTFFDLDRLSGHFSYDNGSTLLVEGDTLSARQLADLTFFPAVGEMGTTSISFLVHDAEGAGMPATMSLTNRDPSGVIQVGSDSEVIDSNESETEVETEAEVEIIRIDLGGVAAEISNTSQTVDPKTKSKSSFVQKAEPVEQPVARVQPVIDLLKDIAIEPKLQTTPVPEEPKARPPEYQNQIAEPARFVFAKIDQPALMQDLDRVGSDLRTYDDLLGASVAKVTFTFGSLLSVGGVSFVLRSGLLATALMSAIPAWTRFDPISIVSARKDDDDTAEPSDTDMMLAVISDAGARVRQDSLL